MQHCSCSAGIPDCCPGGWRIALAGSRFLTPAEQRYAAIKGEALAVAWVLNKPVTSPKIATILLSSLITNPWSKFLVTERWTR